MTDTRVLLEGLGLPESPRWHDGALWLSDMDATEVLRLDVGSGSAERVVSVPGAPSGLGWDRDGRLLVVGMSKRLLMRVVDGELETVADLRAVSPSRGNDMVVTASGRAYVGNIGFSMLRESPAPTRLACVEPDGAIRAVGGDLLCPNGMVLTPDERTLVVAETFAARLTAFDVHPDGSLGGRRLWADLGESPGPDGICLDAEGAVWVAEMGSPVVRRIAEGGRVLDTVRAGQGAYACMLGGDDGRTLFVCTAPGLGAAELASRRGTVEAVEVPVPHGGRP